MNDNYDLDNDIYALRKEKDDALHVLPDYYQVYLIPLSKRAT